MNFGDALEAMRTGYAVRREGWGGKILAIVSFPPLESGRLTEILGGEYIPFRGANGDLLAVDWKIAGEYPPAGTGGVLRQAETPFCPHCLSPVGGNVLIVEVA